MHERHGFNLSDRIYRIWVAMRQRCAKKYRTNYANYGGRGIKVCQEWDKSFSAFMVWAFANGYDDKLSIERNDPNGNYEPGNCRWATPREQSVNQRRTCSVEVNGVSLTVKEWADKTGIIFSTLYRRYHRGVRGPEFIRRPHKAWTIEQFHAKMQARNRPPTRVAAQG